MSGKPVQEKLLADIEASGGWERIWERVAEGESQASIARSFLRPADAAENPGQPISRGFFQRVMYLDPARAKQFREAKRVAAMEYAEQAVDIVDNVPVDRDHISKAREQASVRRFLASSFDRDTFGEAAPDINVTVNNHAELHLDALRHRMVEAPRPVEIVQRPEPLQLPEPWPDSEQGDDELFDPGKDA